MQYKKTQPFIVERRSLAESLFCSLAVGYLMELQTLWDTEARSKIIKGVATIDLSTLGHKKGQRRDPKRTL